MRKALILTMALIAATGAYAADFSAKNTDGVTVFYDFIDGGNNEVAVAAGNDEYYVGAIVIPAEVTHIGEYAFDGCTDLQRVSLPEALTEIGQEPFSYCNSLKKIYLPATTPPATTLSTFVKSNFDGCVLYVPKSAVSKYESSEIWSQHFKHIEPIK